MHGVSCERSKRGRRNARRTLGLVGEEVVDLADRAVERGDSEALVGPAA